MIPTNPPTQAEVLLSIAHDFRKSPFDALDYVCDNSERYGSATPDTIMRDMLYGELFSDLCNQFEKGNPENSYQSAVHDFFMNLEGQYTELRLMAIEQELAA